MGIPLLLFVYYDYFNEFCFVLSLIATFSELGSIFQEIQERQRRWEIPQELPVQQEQQQQQLPRRRKERLEEEQTQQEKGRVRDSNPVASVRIDRDLDLNVDSTPVINVGNLKHTIDNFQAGAVSRCIEKWEQLTCDPWILNMIEGYELDFLAEPSQDFRPKPLRLESKMEEKLQDALREFLELGIIEECDENEYGFYSNLFPVPKKIDAIRVIFNLSELNEFIDCDHFKMDTVKQAIELMTEHCYFASVDFKNAYYSVS
ncbi:MAG: hypothetical protein GY705_31925, partial [Bacteroidetes bacterium]|nr:hypothetical protein [Bacteroidota bacterium]